MWSNKYIGIPYKSGGRDREGIDCWGLARLVYKEEYSIDLPSFSSYAENDTDRINELITQYKEGWTETKEIVPGTLVLLRIRGSNTHIGIAISSTQFLHAREGQDSSIESFSNSHWNKRISGYFKYTEESLPVLNAVPHPLKTQRYNFNIPAGTSLSEVVDILNDKYAIAEELKRTTTIMVNGEIVPKEFWNSTTLKPTDAVEYRAVAEQDALRTILTIALIVAVVHFAPMLAGTAFMTSTFGASALMVSNIAIMTVGTLLIDAIAPIRPPTQPQDPGSSISQLMVTGGANPNTPYGAIPVVLGKVRITPPLGAVNHLTYPNETDSYLNMLLIWGYGPLSIDESTLKIGETPLSSYTLTSQVTYNRQTEPTPEQTNAFNSIYGKDIAQVYSGVALACAGTYATPGLAGAFLSSTFPIDPTTTPADNFTVSIHFPQGLRRIDKKTGDSAAAPVVFNIQYRVNSGTWNAVEVVTIGSNAVKKDGFTWSKQYNIAPATGIIEIRIRRETGDEVEPADDTNTRFYTASTLNTVSVQRNLAPAVDPLNCKIAKTALKIKATDQLNNSIEGINAIVQTWCLYWNGSAWTMGATSNPAALFRYILQHPANPQRILDAEISTKLNLAQLQYWSEYCNLKGFEYNNVLGTQKSILDVLRDICAAGRASPAMVDGKWTVSIDEPKPVIVQHFSPHNSWGFEASKQLPKLPDALKVNYFDEAQNYQEAEVIAPVAGKTVTTAELFETIQLPGVTKKSSIIDHAKWHMAQAKLRPETYTLNTDIEYIVCNRGDRVKVTHHVPMWGLGSGRIRSVISDTVVELDEQVPIAAATNYTIRIRSNTGSSTERTIKKVFSITSISRISNVVTVITDATGHSLSVGDIATMNIIGGALSGTYPITVTSVGVNTFKYAKGGATVVSYTFSSPATSLGTITLTDNYYSRVHLTTTTTTTEANNGDLFLFGEYQKESQDLIVINIEPATNKSARLTLVDYGVTDTYNIFTDYLNYTNSVVFETQITLPPKLSITSFTSIEKPSVSNVQSDDSVTDRLSPGVYSYKIKISFVNPIVLPLDVQYVECQYDYSTSTDTLNYKSVVAPYTGSTVEILNVREGEVYKFRLRYLDSVGKSGEWTAWQNHTVIGKTLNYGEVTLLTVKKSKHFLTVMPTVTGVLSDSFKSYEFRVFKDAGSGDFWDTVNPAIQVLRGTSSAIFDLTLFATPRLSTLGTKYRVACRILDTSGNYSQTSALTSITLTSLV